MFLDWLPFHNYFQANELHSTNSYLLCTDGLVKDLWMGHDLFDQIDLWLFACATGHFVTVHFVTSLVIPHGWGLGYGDLLFNGE